MSQWLRRKIITFMGNVYVWLDKGLEHETSPILGIHINEDFKNMSRYELCNHIENKFGWEKDSFWNLESTQKIRLCCQMARDMESKFKESIKMMALIDEDTQDQKKWDWRELEKFWLRSEEE